jgi:hypothetical protein
MEHSEITGAHRPRRLARLPVVAVIAVVAALEAGRGTAAAGAGTLPSTGSGSSQSLAPWSWDLVGPLLIVAALLVILGLFFRRGGR